MNIAVFASGRGSNLNAILQAIRQEELPVRVCVVLSNNSTAGVLELAREQNIPTVHLSHKRFATEEEYVAAMLEMLKKYRAEFIVLAGYMKRVPSAVVREFQNRILNIHPALLPAFGGEGMFGRHVHEAVIASGAKVSGATVHIVDEEYDRGPVVMQESVEVAAADTPESLAEKVLKIEHQLYPRALKAFAEGRVRIEGRRVWIRPSS